MRQFLITFALILCTSLLITSPVSAGGSDDEELDDNREHSVRIREDTMGRANAQHPIPTVDNFPMREALIEFTMRQAQEGAVYYIYLYDMMGDPYAYIVGQTYPISTCNFLSSSERVIDVADTAFVVTAPSLDGMYYGGGGASAACQGFFVFDASTDALIVFQAPSMLVSDQLLNLDVPQLETVAAATSDEEE